MDKISTKMMLIWNLIFLGIIIFLIDKNGLIVEILLWILTIFLFMGCYFLYNRIK